ncbi:MAG: zinc-dependent alcohol dehydrogenase [Rhizobiales bacterium]|nr:zinc-dependent alcohol dehydrogenase [Hyphomicrobiales bacterium]MBI3673195.1 zinc-dependent alcohol dehydrogenase [Hyphomicrobiales bacterium]
MQAAVLRAIATPLVIETLPVPQPRRGEVLIKVAACGVCHSDLHAVDGDWTPLPTLPLVPGHEVVGHVAGLGEGVEHFRLGEPIGVPWMYSACGTCEFCLSGMETICLKAEATGYTKPGGYAEYMIADAAFCGRIPEAADLYEIAPILCAGVTTYRGIKRTGARPGQWLTVIGIGGLGHIAVQYAKAMGLRVAAVDVSEEKLELARQFGAEMAFNAATTDPVRAIRESIGGSHGAVVTAVSPRAFEQSVGIVRNGGTVAWIGLPGGKQDEIRLSIAAVVNGEVSIRGSSVGTRQDLQEAIDFAANGLVRARIEKAPLADINGIFARMKKAEINGRVVLAIA